jgi:hypothetical protein
MFRPLFEERANPSDARDMAIISSDHRQTGKPLGLLTSASRPPNTA